MINSDLLQQGIEAGKQARRKVEGKSEDTLNKEKAAIVVGVILGYYNTTLEQIKSKSRLREVVMRRQAVCFFLRKFTTLANADIGKIVGYVNKRGTGEHTSVYYSIVTAKDDYKQDDQIKFDFDIISDKIDEMIVERIAELK